MATYKTYKDFKESTTYEKALAKATANLPKILHYAYDSLDEEREKRKIDLAEMADSIGSTISFCQNMLSSNEPFKGVLFKQVMVIIDMANIGAKAFGMFETVPDGFVYPYYHTDVLEDFIDFIHEINVNIEEIFQISEEEFGQKFKDNGGWFEFLYDFEFEKVLKFMTETGLPINFLFCDFYDDCRGFCE